MPIDDCCLLTALRREVIVMALDTIRTNKMRSGAHGARRRHRHHVDRRHDGDDPRFDQSLRDMIRAVGPNTIFCSVRRHQFRERRRDSATVEAAEPDGVRCAGDRRADARRSSSSTSSSAPAGRRRSSGCFTATRRRGRSSCSGPARISPKARASDHRRPVLQRHRTAVPEERRGPRQQPVSAAVRATGIDPSARPFASAPSDSRSSASSTNVRPPAASTSARTTSS